MSSEKYVRELMWVGVPNSGLSPMMGEKTCCQEKALWNTGNLWATWRAEGGETAPLWECIYSQHSHGDKSGTDIQSARYFLVTIKLLMRSVVLSWVWLRWSRRRRALLCYFLVSLVFWPACLLLCVAGPCFGGKGSLNSSLCGLSATMFIVVADGWDPPSAIMDSAGMVASNPLLNCKHSKVETDLHGGWQTGASWCLLELQVVGTMRVNDQVTLSLFLWWWSLILNHEDTSSRWVFGPLRLFKQLVQVASYCICFISCFTKLWSSQLYTKMQEG